MTNKFEIKFMLVQNIILQFMINFNQINFSIKVYVFFFKFIVISLTKLVYKINYKILTNKIINLINNINLS